MQNSKNKKFLLFQLCSHFLPNFYSTFAQPLLELTCKLPATCAVNFRFKHFPPGWRPPWWLCRERAVLSPATLCLPTLWTRLHARHDPALAGQAGVIDWKKDDVSSKGTKCWNEVSSGRVRIKPPLMRDNGGDLALCGSHLVFACPRSDTWPQQSVIAIGPGLGKMWLDPANSFDTRCKKLICVGSLWEMRALSPLLIYVALIIQQQAHKSFNVNGHFFSN